MHWFSRYVYAHRVLLMLLTWNLVAQHGILTNVFKSVFIHFMPRFMRHTSYSSYSRLILNLSCTKWPDSSGFFVVEEANCSENDYQILTWSDMLDSKLCSSSWPWVHSAWQPPVFEELIKQPQLFHRLDTAQFYCLLVCPAWNGQVSSWDCRPIYLMTPCHIYPVMSLCLCQCDVLCVCWERLSVCVLVREVCTLHLLVVVSKFLLCSCIFHCVLLFK